MAAGRKIIYRQTDGRTDTLFKTCKSTSSSVEGQTEDIDNTH